jgi:hypothetical protein
MWMKKDFDDAAQKISSDYMAAGGTVTINDLVTKVAEDAQLSPDGIRTIVGLANVAVFEHRFAKSAEEQAEDRMDASEFEVGDADIIINRVYQNAKEAHFKAHTTVTYNQQVDLFGDISMSSEKTAGDDSEDEDSEELVGLPDTGTSKKKDKEKDSKGHYSGEDEEKKEASYSKAEIRLLFKRAEDRMKERAVRAQVRWENLTKEAASRLIAQDSRVIARVSFEKNAAAMLGEDVLPELTHIFKLTSKVDTPLNLFGGEKVASVMSTHIVYNNREQLPIIELTKEAMQVRKEFVKNINGLKWLKENKDRVK